MKTFNALEKIVPYLHEVGDQLLKRAADISEKIQHMQNAGASKAQMRMAIEQDRDALMKRIRANYTDAEIESADVMCNRCNSSNIFANATRVGQGADRFRLTIDHLGAPIRYTVDLKQISAHVFAHYNLTTGKAVVLMVDGNYGASITNAAAEIVPFIQRQHVGRRGIKWKDVRWIYRDTLGSWDEILVNAYEGGNTASIAFSPLGDRTPRAALEAVAVQGIVLDGHDRQHLQNSITSPAL